jgi:hypothetical protein
MQQNRLLRMIAFYIVGMSMKILRNALFVNSTDSIVEKMAVITRTTTEEMTDLKRCFDTFLSFLILNAGLQIKMSQNCCDATKISINRTLE